VRPHSHTHTESQTLTSPDYGTYTLSGWQQRLLTLAQRQERTWLGRRLALVARRLVLKGRTQPIDASADGFRMRVHVTDNVSERKFLFMPQFCDISERDYLVSHLTADGVFLDIGANAGIYSLTAARAYAASRGAGYVLAVEANPTMQARLDYNVRLNALESQVRLARVALSDRSGEVTFNISSSNLGESSLAPTEGTPITVPCQTLLSLLQEHGVSRVDGMKIDVEGMEDVILMPFFGEAPRALYPRFVIIENSSSKWRSDLFGRMQEVGYRLLGTHKMNSILVLDSPG
jgi:FkbM family methyltransferase